MNTFEWCGYNWTCEMDGHSIIHPDQPWMWYSLSTIRIDNNSQLELFIEKNPKYVSHYNGKTYHPKYEASTMRSIEDFSYGIFSAEIMLPTGRNLWPSFWLTGSKNWPPEIDIMEAWSGDCGYFKWFIAQPPYLSPSWRTTTNVHYNNEVLEHKSSGSRNISIFKQPLEPSENWIEYKCKWEPKKITFYANDKVVREIKGYECQQLTKNLKDPDKGFKMNVIFNVWIENPDKHKIDMVQPMLVRNFKYISYEKD